MTEQNAYEGHAIVELMGHNVIAGYVSEQTIAGVAMLRVDVPKVGDQEPFTKFFSGGAIYGITPTTQEIAERAAQRLRSRPVSEYVVPVPPPRPTLVDSTTGDDEDDDEDDDEYQDSEIGF
jgi:hypothetical protein